MIAVTCSVSSTKEGGQRFFQVTYSPQPFCFFSRLPLLTSQLLVTKLGFKFSLHTHTADVSSACYSVTFWQPNTTP